MTYNNWAAFQGVEAYRGCGEGVERVEAYSGAGKSAEKVDA